MGTHLRDFLEVHGPIYSTGFYGGNGGQHYFVDTHDGNDGYDGKSWTRAFATIQVAITAANTHTDWSDYPDKFTTIYVAPGVYDENLTPPYYTHLVGCGVHGTNSNAEINPTTGSAFTGTFLGTCLHNLWLQGNSISTPILNLGVCNGSVIEGCHFHVGGGATGIAAIDTDDSHYTTIRNCDFSTAGGQYVGYAGYHRGGANKYANGVQWLNNRIHATTAGIWVQNTCTSTQMLIKEKFIYIDAAGIGVDINDPNAKGAIVVNNYIVGGAAADAIEHSGGAGLTLYNHTNIAGAAAEETA